MPPTSQPAPADEEEHGAETSDERAWLVPGDDAESQYSSEADARSVEPAPSAWVRRWRAEQHLRPRGPLWCPDILRITWYLQVLVLVQSIQDTVDGDLFGPFFWTRTSCCGNAGTPVRLGPEFDVSYPETLSYLPFLDYSPANVTTLVLNGCELPMLPNNHVTWSHSIYCPSFAYVRYFQQIIWATRNSVMGLVALVAMPMGAGLGDSVGRKPILVFSAVMVFKGLVVRASVCGLNIWNLVQPASSTYFPSPPTDKSSVRGSNVNVRALSGVVNKLSCTHARR